MFAVFAVKIVVKRNSVVVRLMALRASVIVAHTVRFQKQRVSKGDRLGLVYYCSLAFSARSISLVLFTAYRDFSFHIVGIATCVATHLAIYDSQVAISSL